MTAQQMRKAIKAWRRADTGRFEAVTTLYGQTGDHVTGSYELSSRSTSMAMVERGTRISIYTVSDRHSMYVGTRPGGDVPSCWLKVVPNDLLPSFAAKVVGPRFPSQVDALRDAQSIEAGQGNEAKATTNLPAVLNALGLGFGENLPAGAARIKAPISVQFHDGEVAGWTLDQGALSGAVQELTSLLPLEGDDEQLVIQGFGLTALLATTVTYSDLGEKVDTGLPDSAPVVLSSASDAESRCTA